MVAKAERIDGGRRPEGVRAARLVPRHQQIQDQRYIQRIERIELGNTGLIPQARAEAQRQGREAAGDQVGGQAVGQQKSDANRPCGEQR